MSTRLSDRVMQIHATGKCDNNKFIGNPCKRPHHVVNGKSVRYKSNQACVLCIRLLTSRGSVRDSANTDRSKTRRKAMEVYERREAKDDDLADLGW